MMNRGARIAALTCWLELIRRKVAELRDREVFHATHGAVSGHTIKHLASGLATLVFYAQLAGREPVVESESCASALGARV